MARYLESCFRFEREEGSSDYLPIRITSCSDSSGHSSAAVQLNVPCDGKCYRNADGIVQLNPLERPSSLVSRAARRGQGNRQLFYLRFVVQSVVR